MVRRNSGRAHVIGASTEDALQSLCVDDLRIISHMPLRAVNVLREHGAREAHGRKHILVAIHALATSTPCNNSIVELNTSQRNHEQSILTA